MTVTDLDPIRVRRRVRTSPERTPESQQVKNLRAMLEDPAEEPNWPDIRKAIDYLTATSVLAA